MLLKNTLPIVLTATIYPRAIMTVHLTASERRLEYLNAVKYYTKFSHVYLLENSGFNFKDDLDFCSCENVTYIQLEPSNEFNKGKGFQEFEMLDNWFKLYGSKYRGFVKITGRYIVENIADILEDACVSDSFNCIFERKKSYIDIALTDLFYSGFEFYDKKLLGCYLFVDDKEGYFIEHVVGKILKNNPSTKVFSKHPIKTGISGSHGGKISGGIRAKSIALVRNLIYVFFEKNYRLL
jgi:hypothetical protein